MKVHFAGHEDVGMSKPLKKAGVNYVLGSFYQIRRYKNEQAINFIKCLNSYKHTIIDSGLFTLMFGAKSHTVLTEQMIIDWQNDYANFVNKTGYKHSIVECDVQKKISPEFAWEMRKKFKTQVNVPIINVYHLEDENPDKLIDHADYIAVSVPELRFNVSNKERMRITRYISQKATSKGKKVHLLGCTELKMMKEFQYCYSCDSTSWFSGSRFNSFKSKALPNMEKVDINKLKNNKVDEFKDLSKSSNVFYWEAYLKLQEYKQYAGSQA